MTERDTASVLRAALQRRAEDGMQTTNTDRELHRLHGQMAPVRRRRQLRAALATAAAVAVIGGGVGLGLALSSEDQNTTPLIPTRPTPTTLPAGTLPAGFPIGTFSHPGGTGLTTLKITRGAVAWVGGPDGTGRNQLTFAAPDVVIFDVTNTVDCRTPGRYQWSVARNELTLTAVSDSCSQRRIVLTELPWGPIVKTQSP
jgi:hypothetical protein